jgi:hypothetical protein
MTNRKCITNVYRDAVPEEKQLAVGELVIRLNRKIGLGYFKLNHKNEAVNFTASIPVGQIVDDIVLQRSLATNWMATDFFFCPWHCRSRDFTPQKSNEIY